MLITVCFGFLYFFLYGVLAGPFVFVFSGEQERVVIGFYVDGVANTIPGPWPESAVVLMTKINNDNHAILIVDIEHKFLWMGESQVFWNDTYLTNNRGAFLQNLICFVANASKYGSHFTDLLLEDGATNAQPAPWDNYWGANAEEKAKF